MRHRPLGFLIAIPFLAVLARAGACAASDGLPVCTTVGNQHGASIVSDGAGGAIIVWLDGRDGRSDIYAQRMGVREDLKWDASGVAISQLGSTMGSPSIAVDGVGGAFIAWDFRTSLQDTVLVQRLAPSGAAAWTCVASPPYFAGRDPVVVPNGAGGALVTWYAYPPVGVSADRAQTSFVGADIFVQRINSAGALEMGASGEAISAAEGDQFSPSASPAGAGGALVTWQDVAAYEIDYAQYVLPDGTAMWGAGLPLSSIQADKTPARGVWDGSEGGICVWSERRSGTRDIFLQHMVASGPQWGSDGIPVCAAEGDQQSPDLVSDGANGAIVVWFDSRSGLRRLFTQRAKANGTFEWAENGIDLCGACAVQSGPVMTSDGAGGAIIAWVDSRDGQPDIYAQRVTASGTLAWGQDGVAVCTAPGAQTEPSIVTDGAGGAIVAWTDARNGVDTDIYAQRIDSTGVLVAPYANAPTSISEGSAPLSVAPNPIRGAARVQWVLSTPGPVDISVFDLTGRIVSRLVSGGEFPAGRSSVSWDGRDAEGRSLPAGLYLVHVKTSERSMMKEIALLR